MQNNDRQQHTNQVASAYRIYMDAIAKCPIPRCLGPLHADFADLTKHNFHIPGKGWLNPYELAHVVNYAAMYGDMANNLLLDLSKPLNALKNLWKLAEQENEYSENEEYIASFMLRWIYQQLPYTVAPERVLKICEITRELFGHPKVSAYVESSIQVRGELLVDLGILLMRAFQRHPDYREKDLLKLDKHSAELQIVLGQYAANRQRRLDFHQTKLEVHSPINKPYELNSLLRYPIAMIGSEYYAPYPELIGYAGTRGLFFRFSEEGKQGFRDPFADAMEQFTSQLLHTALPQAEIISEQNERELGWTGKTNDVSVVVGETALLFECKASAFFVDAKRTAAPKTIIADVRRNLANAEKGKGLFQLYNKIKAIRAKDLPVALMKKYEPVKRFFPVMLLFDAIEHANAASVVGNIIDDELRANGIVDFKYQIWHLEELTWLAGKAQSEMMEWVEEKFRANCYSVGLNSFIANKTGLSFLNPIMYMPRENTKAFKILTDLSAKQPKCKPD